MGIAQALLGSPQVIILDEPTVGLDPAQVIEMRRLIQELGKSHTVILSSPYPQRGAGRLHPHSDPFPRASWPPAATWPA